MTSGTRGLKKLLSLLPQRTSAIPVVHWAKRYQNFVNWFSYRFAFSKPALFITGLVYSFSLVQNAVICTWMTYFTDNWERTVPQAAAVINVMGAIRALMALGIAYVNDAFIDCFTMLLFSVPAYTTGLVILYVSGWQFHRPSLLIIYMGLVFIAWGQAIRKPILNSFFANQFRKESKDESQVKARSNIWWLFFTFLGFIVTIFYLGHKDSGPATKITALTMGATYFLFLCGTPFYFRERPGGSSLTMVYKVFQAAFLKRHLNFPLNLCLYYQEEDDNLQSRSLQLTNHLRCLNKAAIIESSAHTQKEWANKWRLCSVKQVEHTKLLFRMVPMWMTFLVYGLVQSIGTTFFIQQGDTMDDYVGNFEVPLISLFVVESASKSAVSYLYKQLSKKLTESQEHRATKVQMGLGMVSFTASCFVASLVEVKRLCIVKEKGLIHEPEKTVPMTIFFLFPQFCLLGAGKALAEDGLLSFFNNQIPESLRSYGPALDDCVIGIGNLLCIILVNLTGYVGDTLNTSRLDKFYRMLTLLSCANLVLHCYLSRRYKYNETTSQELIIKHQRQQLVNP